MFWHISGFPPCEHHVFLSHCREDHDALVKPVYDTLLAAGVRPWIDREDYYYGRDSRVALRDGVLESRHTVFFVTDAMLTTGRGWCVLELAFAELVQANLSLPGGPVANVFLPLFFVPITDDRLPRTVWQLTRDRGRFVPPDASDPVRWAAGEVLYFVRREERLARDWRRMSRADADVRKGLEATPGLKKRVIRFDPAPLPPPG